MIRRLLRDKPYKISSNSKKFNSMRVVLHPDCFKLGEEVYQAKREDGVIELIPQKEYYKYFCERDRLRKALTGKFNKNLDKE